MDELQALVDRMSMVLAELRLAELSLAPPPAPVPLPPLAPGPLPGPHAHLAPPPGPPPVDPPPPIPSVLRDHWSPLPKSNYRGVTWNPNANKWKVQLSNDTRGPTKHVGYFHDELEAAHAYDEAGAERGYLANKLNFPST